MAAALLFVSSPCPLVRTTCMHPRPTRSRFPSQGHGMGGEAERRLHFRHGPPPPQGKGDAVSRVWALSRQVLPTGRRLAGGSRGLGPWPDPPSLPRRTALLPKVSVRGAFTWQRLCLHNEAALPSNSGATASAMLHAFGMLQHCIPTLQRCQWTAATAPVDGSNAVVGQ